MARGTNEVYEYIESIYNPDPKLKVIRNSPKLELQVIQLAYPEGKVIQFLLSLINAQTVMEIGVLAGYSAYMLAQALPNGQLVAVEKDLDAFNLAKQNLANVPNVELIHGSGLDVMQSFPENHFDAIFIDANKKAYKRYLKEAHRIVRTGGIVIFDNTLMYGDVCKEDRSGINASLDKFNKHLADNSKYESIIIPTDSGLSVARKK